MLHFQAWPERVKLRLVRPFQVAFSHMLVRCCKWYHFDYELHLLFQAWLEQAELETERYSSHWALLFDSLKRTLIILRSNNASYVTTSSSYIGFIKFSVIKRLQVLCIFKTRTSCGQTSHINVSIEGTPKICSFIVNKGVSASIRAQFSSDARRCAGPRWSSGVRVDPEWKSLFGGGSIKLSTAHALNYWQFSTRV